MSPPTLNIDASVNASHRTAGKSRSINPIPNGARVRRLPFGRYLLTLPDDNLTGYSKGCGVADPLGVDILNRRQNIQDQPDGRPEARILAPQVQSAVGCSRFPVIVSLLDGLRCQ